MPSPDKKLGMLSHKLFALSTLIVGLHAFQPISLPLRTRTSPSSATAALASTSASTSNTIQTVQQDVEKLKTVLEREYLSFFDPMEKQYYADRCFLCGPAQQF